MSENFLENSPPFLECNGLQAQYRIIVSNIDKATKSLKIRHWKLKKHFL